MPKNKFDKLPQDKGGVTKEITDYLSEKDVASVTEATQSTHTIFKLSLEDRKLTALLSFVAKGDQNKAQKLLERHPELLLKAGNTTDYSGRTFKHVTALQLVCWSYDKHMGVMMLDCIPKNQQGREIITDLLAQERALEENGIAYEMAPITYRMGDRTYTIGSETNSCHYDPQPLFDAYQFYLDNYDQWENDQNQVAMQHHWSQVVGLLQRLFPAHWMKEICHPHRSFAPEPSFNENRLLQTFKAHIYNTGIDIAVFPLDLSETSGLGIDFGLARGDCTQMGRGRTTGLSQGSRTDLIALKALDRVRHDEFRQAPEILSRMLDAPELDDDLSHS